MSIYVIADLHLSFNTDKPMEVFGENWKEYEQKIKNNWLEKVNEKDIVILPGDFSWSMKLEDTYYDFKFIEDLPGKKILLKGNHDYWWNTLAKMRKFLLEKNFQSIDFLYNNSYEFENIIIVGTRGWTISDNEDDKKITKREVERLELSIKDSIAKYGKDKEIILFMHYPPITKNNLHTAYIDTMKKYNIKKCFYGHLHSISIQDAIEGNIEKIEFKLISADALEFNLYKIK